MSLIEFGTALLKTDQLLLCKSLLEPLWAIEDLWMFIGAVPFFAAMFSWPIGYWTTRPGDQAARGWFADQLILVGVGVAFGGGFLVANALS